MFRQVLNGEKLKKLVLAFGKKVCYYVKVTGLIQVFILKKYLS